MVLTRANGRQYVIFYGTSDVFMDGCWKQHEQERPGSGHTGNLRPLRF